MNIITSAEAWLDILFSGFDRVNLIFRSDSSGYNTRHLKCPSDIKGTQLKQRIKLLYLNLSRGKL